MKTEEPISHEWILDGDSPRIDRRRFLRTLGVGAISATMLGSSAYAQLNRSRVVQVSSEQDLWQTGVADPKITRNMVDVAILELTGRDELAEAWKDIAAPEDIFGIKINPAAGPALASHRAIVDHVIEGLRSAGVPDEQILIWDRFEGHLRDLGYDIQTEDAGIRCYATDGVGPGYDPRVFYDTDEDMSERRQEGGSRSHFSKIVTQDVNKIINIPVLKQHIASGVSLSLKNLAFGSVDNTVRFHGNEVNCNPAIAEICDHTALRQKLVLNILDGLRGCFDNGPGYTEEGTWDAGLLLASFDPVALDHIGMQIIDDRRKEANLPSIQSQARHISTAARLGLGTTTPEEIDLREQSV